MEVLNRTSDGLKRCYNILLSSEELEAAKISKLQEIAKKIKLDGFRPGKVPVDVVKRMYGDSISDEAKNTLIESTANKVLIDEKLSISFRFLTDIVKEDEKGLEFTLKFELVPTFELKDLSKISLMKHSAEITDSEVNDLLEDIRKARKNWVVDKSAKVVKEGQHISIDLNLLTSIKKYTGGNTTDLEITIGDETLIDDFWKHLIGAKIGETREFDIQYPKNFGNKNFAGKKLHYSATVKKILKSEEFKLDDVFAKAIGYEDLEKAKTWAKSHLISKYEHIAHDIMKRDLLEKISEIYDFSVPSNMVSIEKAEVEKQIKAEAPKYNKEFTPEIEKECEKLAIKRVRLGFIIAEIAKKEKINVSRNEVTQAIKNIAMMYPGQEKMIYDIYRRPEALNAVVGPLLESKVVDFILDKLTPTENKCSVAELIAIDEEPFDFFKDSEPKAKKAAPKKSSACKKETKSSEKSTGDKPKKTTRKKKTEE